MKSNVVIGLCCSAIVGLSLIIASIIIVKHLPRYQYGEIHDIARNDDGSMKTCVTTMYVFDMVTGNRYYSSNSVYYGRFVGDESEANYVITPREDSRPLHKLWELQQKAFGNKMFTADEWTRWCKNHPDGLK